MADKKLDKTTLTIIVIAIFVIAIAIFIWFSQRKEAQGNGNGNGNGGDLINRGTTNYIEVKKTNGEVYLEYYNQRNQNIATSSPHPPEYGPGIWSDWYEANTFNLIQYDNALAQLSLMGY